MKSKPFLYLVIGAAALALWFASQSSQTPSAVRFAVPTSAQSSPPLDFAAPVPMPNRTSPTTAPVAPMATPGVSPPTGSSVVPVGLVASQVPDVPGAALNPGQPLRSPDQAAQIDVGRVRHMISDYHTLMGENPVGTNAEIMKQMTGGNPRQATLGPPEGLSLNGRGELVDPWGSPYFFHQLSRDRMEVRSAGPDQVMWTADDVITR